MAKEFIVAIEIGSSFITGMAGRKNNDGSISVLAVAKQDSSDCIRKGVVYKLDKTVTCLTNIVNKLELALHNKVAKVYVGVGGRSIHGVRNVVVKELPDNTIIDQGMVEDIMDNNRSMSYLDLEMLDSVTQEYKVDQHYQLDPVGIQCHHLEGNFLNILWRKTYYSNLNRCFELANIKIAEMWLAPLALADSVLLQNEKRNGCVLVDLGAETTTVLVYFKDLLRHIAVIPLGGSNITRDITSKQVDDQTAEMIKLKYASAYTDDADIDKNLEIETSSDRKIKNEDLVTIVEARVQEIIMNVTQQVPAEYTDKLVSGFILTGGGSNMKNIDKAFEKFANAKKVRIAKSVEYAVDSTMTDEETHSGKMNTILGLLAKGEINCAGPEFSETLFPEVKEEETPVEKETPAVGREPGMGSILTEEEKRKKEEEEARQREIEEEKLREKQRKEEEERKKNSVLNKIGKGMKDFFRTMTSAEEE